MRLIQKAPIGIVLVELDSQECLMLRLLMCPESQIKDIWVKLWEKVPDYEVLHFFCKDFMPTVVARLNRLGLLDELLPVVKGNRHFMRGLPKFIWLKNQLILREAHQLASLFTNAGFDFAFFKGVGRMFELGGSGLYRISRDIDVLVPWDQFDESIDLLLKNKWEIKGPANQAVKSIGRINSITLCNPMQGVDIDLHRSLFHDAGNDCLPLMNHIWSRAKVSTSHKHLYILSRRDQLLVAIHSTFNLFNWETSQFCKYIYDAAQILQEMNEEELNAFAQDLVIVKLNSQFIQTIRVLEGLDISLAWESLRKNRELADLENSLANYLGDDKNEIAIQGMLAMKLIGWCGTVNLFFSAIKKNPFHTTAYIYLFTKVIRVISKLSKSVYCSVFSIKEKAGPSIFKNRLRWYLFS